MNSNTYMQKILSGLFLGLFLVVPAMSAQGSGSTSLNTSPSDFPTVEVMNYTLYPGSTNNWSTSISGVSEGQQVSVNIYYHNSGANTAENVRLRLNQPSTGSASSFTFSGSVSADNANTSQGSATVNLTSSQTLTFVPGSLAWRPNQCTSSACTTPLPGGQNESAIFGNGINIGSVAPGWNTQGNLVMLFRVGQTQSQNPIISSFYAQPASINTNQSTQLYWSVQNASTCTLSRPGASATVSPTGSPYTTSQLTQTTTYTLTCQNATGNSTQATTVVTVGGGQAPVIANFTAAPSSVTSGQSATLSWSVTNATACFINGGTFGNQSVNAQSGTLSTGALTTNTTYTLNCSNNFSTDTRNITVNVSQSQNPIISSFYAQPASINTNQSTQLYWSVQNASTCTLSRPGASATVSPTGSPYTTAQLLQTTTYTLICQNAQGISSSPATTVVTVNGQAPVIANFSATPNPVNSGQSATLSWSVNDATACFINGGTFGNQSVNAQSGTLSTGALITNTTYTLNCQNNFSTDTHTINVAVSGSGNQQPIISSFYGNPQYLSYNGNSTLYWSVQNANACTLNGGTFSNTPVSATSGNVNTGTLYGNTTYYLNCTNGSLSNSANTTITVSGGGQQVDVTYFNANPNNVNYGGSTTLTWGSTNASYCTASGGWNGNKSTSGSEVVNNIYTSQNYTITCYGNNGNDVGATYVTVTGSGNQYPIISSFYASPNSVTYNNSSNLYWTVSNASYCTASGDWSGSQSLSGNYYTGNLTSSRSYTLTCYSTTGNQTTQTVTVTVSGGGSGQNSTIDYFYASPSSASYGTPVTLYWSTSYMQNCYASGDWSGSQALSGSYNTSNTYNNSRTYTLNCTGNQGLVTRTVTVGTTGGTSFSFYADQTYVDYNGNTTLRWSAPNSGSCYATGDWSGTQNNVGSFNTGPITFTRIYTLNCGGVSQSVTITTGAQTQLPTVVTNPATSVTSSTAVLNGYFVQSGQNATAWFEYGTTASLGTRSASSYVGNYSSAYFTRGISGLVPNTTYYFRAVGQNSAGTAYGSILSFTTLSSGIVSGTTATNVASISKEVRNLSFPNGTKTAIAAWAGNTIQYTITVTNTGTETLRNLKVTDALPEGVSFKGASNSGYYDSDDRTVRFTIDTLSAGDSVKLTIDTNAGLFKDNIVATNVARVTGSQIAGRTSNSTLAIINLYPFILTINSDQEVVGKGEIVNFRVMYRNEGEANLTNVVLRVILPAGMEFVGTDRNGFSQDKNVLTWGLGNISPKDSSEFNVRAKVIGDLPSDLKLTTSAVVTYFDAFSQKQTDVNSYKTITVDPNKQVTAAVVSGVNTAATGLSGFFPQTLVGWLLLLLLLVILAVLIKRAFDNRKDQ